jgi:uncharacterized protein YacL
MKLTITLEAGNKGELFGVVSTSYFTFSTVGKNKEEVTENILKLILDFIKHEGKDIAKWKDVDIAKVKFAYNYSLLAFFKDYDVLKISKIAELSGINESLVRQYATDVKSPSLKQVKKIEDTVHKLGEELMKVRLK